MSKLFFSDEGHTPCFQRTSRWCSQPVSQYSQRILSPCREECSTRHELFIPTCLRPGKVVSAAASCRTWCRDRAVIESVFMNSLREAFVIWVWVANSSECFNRFTKKMFMQCSPSITTGPGAQGPIIIALVSIGSVETHPN